MAVINKNIKLPSTSTKVVGNGNTSVKLPTSSKNNTGGLYGQFTPTIGNTGGTNNTPTTPVGVGTLKPITVGGNGTGGTYGAVLTPELPTSITTPVYTPIIGGGSVGGVSVKPIDASQYFDGSVVGTVGGGFSGSNKGGVTDEGVIVGGSKNADDATFDNNGFKGTGATFVPSASGSGNSGKTQMSTTGTGAGASTGANTGASENNTPTTDEVTETETDETAPMTYEEYIAEAKAREEERRQASLKEAEIYKERAAADAQASYMQNMSTYGVNAENMAQMGLTGGGYSDYLNAQAYAQKRGEMQTASANEMALKQQAETTYADNIAALDGDLFNYQETQRQNKTTAYNTLLGYAMDSESGLSEETIKTMGASAGLSDEEIQTIIDTWNSTETKAKGDYSAGIKMNAYEMIETNGGMTTEYINSLKEAGVTDEDIADIIAYNQKYHYNGYKSLITSGETVNASDIDTAYNDGRLNKEQYDELKTLISNSQTDSIKNNISAEGSTSASIQANIDNADELYSSGKITQAQYQSIYKDYVSLAVNGVENVGDYKETIKTMDEYKAAGKLSESDYNAILATLKKNNTACLDKSKYSVSGDSEVLKETDDIDVTIDGKTYDLVSGKYVEEDSTKKLLNEIATGDSGKTPSIGTIVVVCGKMYIYRKWGAFGIGKKAHWHEMGDDSDDVADAAKAYMGQSDGSSGGGGTSVGASGGGGEYGSYGGGGHGGGGGGVR